MPPKEAPKEPLKEPQKEPQPATQFQKLARAIAIVCIVVGGGAGLLFLVRAVVPSLFTQSGEESMAFAIGVFSIGLLATLLGCTAACFAPRPKLRLVLISLVFIPIWILSEMIRVSQYPR